MRNIQSLYILSTIYHTAYLFLQISNNVIINTCVKNALCKKDILRQ